MSVGSRALCCSSDSCETPCKPRPVEVKASYPAKHIQQLSADVDPWMQPAFQCGTFHILEPDASTGYFCLQVRSYCFILRSNVEHSVGPLYRQNFADTYFLNFTVPYTKMKL